MRAGVAPSGPVTSPASTVTLRGVPVPVDSVEVTRDLPSDLPSQVAGGGGLTAATGSVVWARSQAVVSRDVSPWAPSGVPVPGDAVTVGMDAGTGQAHRVLTGAVDDSSGGSSAGVSSSLVDHVYRLDRKVSVPPLLRLMPPATEGGEFRRMGLTAIYVVDRVMRACGFFTTPRAEWDCAVSVPLQTSVWPEHGLLTEAGSSAGSTNSHAAFVNADGRMYGHDLVASFTPRGTPKPVTTAVQLSVTVGAAHAGAFDLHARYGTASTVTLTITSAGTAQARLDGALVVSRAGVAGQRVSLLVKGGTWTIRTSGGLSASAPQTVSGSTVMSSVTMAAAPGARVAGVMVSWPRDNGVDEHASLTFTPNARVRPGNVSYGLLDATPAVVARRALEVLTEISAATCSPMWLDEDGVLQWAGPDVLRSQAPAVTVQARESLLSLDWRVSLDQVRSSTTVTWSQAQITVGRFPWVTLWDGSKETLDASTEINEFIDVPSGEDWVMVDLPGQYAGTSGSFARLNAGKGSWVGGYSIDDAGTPQGGWFTTALGSASLSKVTDGTYLHRMSVTSLPAGSVGIATEVSPWSGGAWPKWHGQPLPLVRGFGKVTWAEVETPAEPSVPSVPDRPDLVHDAGPWAQRTVSSVPYGPGDPVGRLANWVASQVSTPVPEVTGLEIMPDPRIQLGDVVAVSDPDNLGVALTGLVVGVRVGQSGPGMSMSLSLRVVAADPTHVSYDDLQAAWAGADYAALEAAWSGADYTSFETTPLEETP